MTEADILAKTYYHKAKVIRAVPVNDGPYDDYKDTVIYENLPCAVSFTQGSTQGVTDTTQAIEYIATFFARPEIEIEAGDTIQARIFGKTYVFLAGEGILYQSHIEVPLIRRDRA